jgi:hypothetical protein
MPLDEATVRPVVDGWVADAPATWTAAETDAIVARLLQISAQVTPHVVADVAQAPARLQDYLVARVVGRIEDWLSRVAGSLRDAYGLEALTLAAGGATPATGLRGARDAELDALPGTDAALAAKIGRFVAQSSSLTDFDRLLDIDGIGPQRLRRLRAAAYLDRPRPALISPTLLAFLTDADVLACVRLMEATDLELGFGDGSTLLRRPIAPGRTPAERFTGFLDTVLEQSARASSVADGVLASDAERWLDRHAARASVLAALAPADGGVLIDDAYLAPALALVEGATTSVNLMVFLGTAAGGTELAPGPLSIVQAMEAAAGRGVAVRAILDQDDGGEPYRSFFINRALVRRFAANGVDVKVDTEDVLLHSKVLVADRAAVIVGSHNLTENSLQDTHELSALITSADVAGEFDDRFHALWNQLPAL